MRNDGQKPQAGVPRSNGSIPTSLRSLSGYLRIVSSGASTVASTVRSAASAASAIADRGNDAGYDQVLWVGFDKLQCEGGNTRQALLLGYGSGFQVWDVEEANNVHNLVSRYDGPVSFMHILPRPLASKRAGDNFIENRPLLAVCANGYLTGGGNVQNGFSSLCNGSSQNWLDAVNGVSLPTVVRFYSLRSQSYVHELNFRSVVYSIRCSARVVAVSQAAQIHCFDAGTMERDYTIMTNPIASGCSGFGGIGYGPLAMGPRWLAYSGTAVTLPNTGHINPQRLTPSASFPNSASNGSLVTQYVKASSKQLAAGIVMLGDMGYKKLSRYCSEFIPESSSFAMLGSPGWKVNGTINGHLSDAENVGMVIVRDIVSKSVIAQFRAHNSPISSLCFDPSGILLVTASVQGHNINVFRIMPRQLGYSSGTDSDASCLHLYKLQRGFTNAVIQDISFSDDSNWIIISSSRGTSHLFALSSSGGSVHFLSNDVCFIAKNSGSGVVSKPAVHCPPNVGAQMINKRNFGAAGSPVTLSALCRIRSGNNGWQSTLTDAAAVVTRRKSSLSGAIASAFHHCKASDLYADSGSLKANYHLLVFSAPGCLIQYALRASSGLESGDVVSGLGSSSGSEWETDARLAVEALQKWNICQKQNRRGGQEDNSDIYGENGHSDGMRIFPEGIQREYGSYLGARGSAAELKTGPKERDVFISEAELQMHEARIPLWKKPEVYFQPIAVVGPKLDREDVYQGEIEIERMPTRMIEARSKDLVPILACLQTPKIPKARAAALYGNNNGHLLHQPAGLSINSGLLFRSSSASFASMTDGGLAVTELPNGVKETGWGHLHRRETSRSFETYRQA